jgi:tetratricopeptide (TPR) repeat protein
MRIMYFQLPQSRIAQMTFWRRRALLAACLLALVCSGAARGVAQDAPRPILDNLDFSDQQAVEQRADLFMVRKFYPEAIQLYERLIKMDPRNASYLNKLGIAHHQNQNLRAARDAYRRAMRLRPNYPEPINNLAAVEYAQKNYRSSILNYLKALKLSPRDPVVYSNLGTAYFAYKKYEYAMNCYRFALQLDPQIFERTGRAGTIVHQRDIKDLAAFNFYMGKTYAAMGQIEQALQYLQKAYEEGFKDLRKQLDDKAFAGLAAEPRYVEFVAMLDAEAQQKD